MIDDRVALKQGLKLLEAQRPKLIEAQQFYEGRSPESFGSYRLSRVLSRTTPTNRFNFARTVITAVTDRLEISSITAADEAESAALQILWDESSMDLEAGDVHEECAVFGSTYVIIWPNDDGVPQFFLNSPLTCIVVYDQENPRIAEYGLKSWELDEDQKRVDVYFEDHVARFVSQGRTQGDEWAPFIDDEGDPETGVVAHEYGFNVFHFRTARPYGRPMHADAYGPQESINEVLTALKTTSQYASYPQRYALSNPASFDGAMDVEQDDEYDLFSSGDRTPAPADFQSHPGSMWMLRGITGVGQFQVSDSKQFLDPLAKYVQSLAALTSTPLHIFDLSGTQPSGASRRAAESPLVKRCQDLQRSLGSAWKDAAEFALKLLGKPTASVTVNWKNPTSVDDLDMWDTAALKISLGVPFDTVMVEMGYTQEQIDEWADAEDQSAIDATVTQNAQAQLGQAITAPAGTATVPAAVGDVVVKPAGTPTNPQGKIMSKTNNVVPRVMKYRN